VVYYKRGMLALIRDYYKSITINLEMFTT